MPTAVAPAPDLIPLFQPPTPRKRTPTPTGPVLGPELPRAVAARRKALGHGWQGRLVFRTGAIPGTAPAPPPDPNDRHIGKRKTARKTIDVQVPVGSVSLRCRHAATGCRAVAVWCWRSDLDKWSFSAAYAWVEGWPEPPEEIDAAAFAAYAGQDVGDLWDDESEAA